MRGRRRPEHQLIEQQDPATDLGEYVAPIQLRMRVFFAVLVAALMVAAALASTASAEQVLIKNGDNGSCLDARVQTIVNNVARDGTTVQLWHCRSNALNQQWYVDAAGGGAVRIRTAEGGLCVGPRPGTSVGNGTAVQLWPCSATDTAQEWLQRGNLLVNFATSGTRTPRNLDARLQDIARDGTPIQLYQTSGYPVQEWFMQPQTGSITASPSVLQVPDGQTGVTTISWSAPGTGATLWRQAAGQPAVRIATGQSGVLRGVLIAPGTTTFTLLYGTDPNEPLAVLRVTAGPSPASPSAVATPCTVQPHNGAASIGAVIEPHPVTDLQNVTTGYGTSVSVAGTLTTAQGVGVPGGTVCVVAQDNAPGAPMQLVASGVSNTGGQFSFPLPAGPSRTVWVVTSGASAVVTTTLSVNVFTYVTLKPNRRHLRNGHVLVLRGSIPGPIPAGGVLLLVQVWRGTYWETFKYTHAGPAGHYVARYRFHFTTTPTTYRMRVVVPDQPAYPFIGNHSRFVRIHVR